MVKKRILIFLAIMMATVVSCDDFLGDNVNPNAATKLTPQLVLPNALTVSADLVRQWNDDGSWIAGYIVNAGGFAGFGSDVTYNYATTDHNGLWSNTYDGLYNYQYILDQTEGDEALAYFNAAARVMKSYHFQHLIDFYNDVPYTNALKGSANVAPDYENAATVYQQLVTELNTALTVFETATLALPMGSADVLFGGDISRWAEFANTIKLRLLIRMSEVASVSSFVSSEFANFDLSVGVLSNDALVNPGYLTTSGKQNPMWNTYHSDAAGVQAGAGRSRIPSAYVFAFYNGTKLSDTYRGSRTYKNFPTTPRGVLGDQTSDQPFAITNFIAWYVGTGVAAAAENTVGLFKGRTAGMPMMLRAEAQFLLAEAQLRGLLAGTAATTFRAGLDASFTYLYKNISGTVVGNPVNDVTAYISDNSGNYLVDFAAATSDEERLEAIITQKYIALNFVHGHEAWSEFRRTTYPAIVNGSSDPVETFASIVSTSSRPDRLPVRVLYPATEYQLNPSTIPADINQFNSRVFWQAQ
ncbi:SusD/RagB family nutrient-binding outer membrane lipoprotein [Chryseotalea sanaruensis]|uniref:SusD/RagB family nutrient-binding outer membrane lipoprotein n=1 Tax=Chryseotalea sanaruensis TaxID=2482724 RepID=A0A401UCB0_9BACT|nr:SusD/RagB family nutrient-binding outer membrane lipoprotein [Chryseotalea sanaruensis]GCC52515.1 SusD/RagB family nutrient-binding outer membrane lipoprotein [Chryseotalea sanaruensis]